MKTIFQSLMLLFIGCASVFAYEGRLDPKGGHIDKKTRDYHYR